MIYYSQGMELEVVSERFRGSVNDVAVCRDRLSATGALYLVLVVHDRRCARTLLDILEHSQRSEPFPCLTHTAQNEQLLFLFPYREERRYTDFVRGQLTNASVAETIAVEMVMACLSTGLPWPLLYLVLEQDRIHLTKDNTVYFTMDLDLKDLDPSRTERHCVGVCTQLVLELLSAPVTGQRRSRRKQLNSFELIRKKSNNGAFRGFPELYQDIRLTAIPLEKPTLKNRMKGLWRRNKDTLFRILLVICVLLVVVAAAMLVTQALFGDIPWLRLFQNTFDIIGTENLHQGGRV